MSNLETASRSLIEAHQLARLQLGLSRLLPANRFYQEKLAGKEHLSLERLADLTLLPYTTKRELVADQAAHPLFGSNLTYPLSDYIRLHQTSGTTGLPLKILDTQESWDWWGDSWKTVYQGSGVTRDDIVFLAFGFGPFIGFCQPMKAPKSLGQSSYPLPDWGHGATWRL